MFICCQIWSPKISWMAGSHQATSSWTATPPTTWRSWRTMMTQTAAAPHFPICRPPHLMAAARWTVSLVPENWGHRNDDQQCCCFHCHGKKTKYSSLPCCQVSVRPAKTFAWSPWRQSPSKSQQASSWSAPSPPASPSTSWCALWTAAFCLTRTGKMHF